jgi:hypothetical protein
MVSGMSQRVALNKTALGAANALEHWSNRLKAELKKQGIARHSKRTPLEAPPSKKELIFGKGGRFSTDDKELVTFERGQIRELLDQMANLAAELRRFEKPVVRGTSSNG